MLHGPQYEHSISRDDNERPVKRPRGSSYDSASFGFEENDSNKIVSRPPHKPLLYTAGSKEKKLSCKECRRLKLKCDRVFPCHSCRKRGCSDICPDGELTSGKGSRFILANTEQLHMRISQLSERVRQLEEGLRRLQGMVSCEPHPLLSPELLQIKISQHPQNGSPSSTVPTSDPVPQKDELHTSVHALSLDGVPPESSGLSMLPNENDALSRIQDSPPPDIHPDVMALSATFPFPWQVDATVRQQIRACLPKKEDALIICQQARLNALWQYNLDASETFLQNLIHHCYTSPIADLRPRRLALLLMVLSIGSLVDLNRPLGSLYGEAYHHLARASICEIPLMEEPDFDVLHGLFFMLWYHLVFSNNNKAVGYAWNLMGFVAKLAQGLGLHRDVSGNRLKLIPEEHEKRKLVFWELVNLDCRMSLSLGRPPSISLRHMDIKPPSYTTQGLYVPKEEIMYHEWKISFLLECLTPVLEAILSTEPTNYSLILSLDKRVRDHPLPPLLDIHNPNAVMVTPRFINMQRALVSTSRDIALLQLHRRCFTEVMNSNGHFDSHHPYAPSVLATYLGASSIIHVVEKLYEKEPELSVRFLMFWFNSFSAGAALSLLVCRLPTNYLATMALVDLERACQLFVKVAQVLPFSGKALPVMCRLQERARQAFFLHNVPAQRDASMNGQLAVSMTASASFPLQFLDAHPALQQHAMKLSSVEVLKDVTYSDTQSETAAYLPEIYTFNSHGLRVEDGYPVAVSQPTPFIPSVPRVDGSETFDFDYGALTVELEDTSFMAWF